MQTLDRAPTYDEQRLAWRQGLSNQVVRELAADHMRGFTDECTADAVQEYRRRFGYFPSVPRGAAMLIDQSLMPPSRVAQGRSQAAAWPNS